MKVLINGRWYSSYRDTWEFRELRQRLKKRYFRQVVASGAGSAFPLEPGRYRLCVSYACPYAHRTILGRLFNGLEDAIPLSVLFPDWGSPDGWTFANGDGDTGRRFLHEIYVMAKPDFTGKVTVPVLWDPQTRTIVNNESADILRMMSTSFRALGSHRYDLYPRAHRSELDALSARIERGLCDGVYAAGFACTQTAYETAAVGVFRVLDDIERRLDGTPFLFGDEPTELDIKLFATLLRFDTVYYTAMKCNLRRIVDMPNLWAFVRRFVRLPGVANTVRMDHIKRHYFDDHDEYNHQLIPIGPETDAICDVPKFQHRRQQTWKQ